ERGRSSLRPLPLPPRRPTPPRAACGRIRPSLPPRSRHLPPRVSAFWPLQLSLLAAENRGAGVHSESHLGTRVMARIDAILQQVKEQGASDLHITTGAPPMIRINGEITPIPYEEIT